MDRHILIILGPQTCVPTDPLVAARRLGCRPIVMGSGSPDECGGGDLVERYEKVSLRRVDDIVRRARELHADTPIHAVTGYDDEVMPIVARIAAELGLRSHTVESAIAARDKPTMKERFVAAGIPIAPYRLASDEDDAVAWAGSNGYPVVVKPLRGGASQGVIRADDEQELRRAYRRLRGIVRDYGLDQGGRPVSVQLVEQYVDGPEYSVEVVTIDGEPHALVVFGKPQELRGPFFEELIYATPPGLSPEVEQEVRELAERSARALGMTNGPGHCELRVTDSGLKVIEMAARLIGASCARAASAVLGQDMHEILLKLALGEPVDVPQPRSDALASGALMYPIPGDGRIRELRGLDDALATPGVSGVTFTVGPGDVVVPFPEQSCYIGMLEAQGRDTAEVERALQAAASKVHMDLEPVGCDIWVRDLTPEDGAYEPPASAGIKVISGEDAWAVREEAVSLLSGVMFDELPLEEALAGASCAVEFESKRYGEDAEPLWVIAREGGVLLTFANGREAHLACGGVLPDLRTSGLGEALFRTQLAALQRRGLQRLNADLDPRLPLLAKVLRKLDFQPPAAPVPGLAEQASCCSPTTCC